MRQLLKKLTPAAWLKEASVETEAPQSGFKIFLLELLKTALFAFVTIYLVRYFLFKPFYVRGASMEPNFFEKEYLIVDELSYRLHDIQRGDIVVFKYPQNPSEFFLKRVIGLPGEQIKIRNGQVIVFNRVHPSGVTLEEDYLPTGLLTKGDEDAVLGSDDYFMMGDNRPSSWDSRSFGPVKQSFIIGRVWLRGWPLDRLTRFEPVGYNIP